MLRRRIDRMALNSPLVARETQEQDRNRLLAAVFRQDHGRCKRLRAEGVQAHIASARGESVHILLAPARFDAQRKHKHCRRDAY